MATKYEGQAFEERFGPWAVIAGGSDGIGAAFAEELARRGLNVALIGRNEAKLAAKAAEIRESHAVEVRELRIDLTSSEVGERVAAGTADLDVGLFVYNAGSGRNMGSILEHEVDNWAAQVNLSCRGPLLLSHYFGRRLRDRGRGGIILLSSLASLVGSSYIATYAAAKAFDTILAEGLWHELAPFGIDVLGCLAGATKTETFLEDTGGTEGAMEPADVAIGALDFLGRGPSYVPGDGNRAAVRAVWSEPRIPMINALSRLNAKNFELPFDLVEGDEFGVV